MAVVKTDSTLFRNPHDGDPVVDPEITRGRPIISTGNVANAAGDSLGSMYRLIDLPADCLLLPTTFFDVQNWGFAQIVIGTRTDTDALVDQTKATGNMVTPIAAGDANHGKRLWQVLGMPENPGGYITLYAHAEANATGAGAMPFQIHYIYR